MTVLPVPRDLPIPNTLSRLNWKSAGLLHSQIRLSLIHQETGTLPASVFPDTYNLQNPNAQTLTHPLFRLTNSSFSSVMQ